MGVGYTDESFIAANANQHEETMFDDDITSALLNGINSGRANALAIHHMNTSQHNLSNPFIGSVTTPRGGEDIMEHSITATDGSYLSHSIDMNRPAQS